MTFTIAVALYHDHFGETPTVVNLSDAAEKAATTVLLDAIDADEVLDDATFFERIGLPPLPPGAVI